MDRKNINIRMGIQRKLYIIILVGFNNIPKSHAYMDIIYLCILRATCTTEKCVSYKLSPVQ